MFVDGYRSYAVCASCGVRNSGLNWIWGSKELECAPLCYNNPNPNVKFVARFSSKIAQCVQLSQSRRVAESCDSATSAPVPSGALQNNNALVRHYAPFRPTWIVASWSSSHRCDHGQRDQHANEGARCAGESNEKEDVLLALRASRVVCKRRAPRPIVRSTDLH